MTAKKDTKGSTEKVSEKVSVRVDKLQRILHRIVDLLPATPNESDTAQLRQDISSVDKKDDEKVETNPAHVTVANPSGVVPPDPDAK